MTICHFSCTKLTRHAQSIIFAQLEDGEVEGPSETLSLSALSLYEDKGSSITEVLELRTENSEGNGAYETGN